MLQNSIIIDNLPAGPVEVLRMRGLKGQLESAEFYSDENHNLKAKLVFLTPTRDAKNLVVSHAWEERIPRSILGIAKDQGMHIRVSGLLLESFSDTPNTVVVIFQVLSIYYRSPNAPASNQRRTIFFNGPKSFPFDKMTRTDTEYKGELQWGDFPPNNRKSRDSGIAYDILAFSTPSGKAIVGTLHGQNGLYTWIHLSESTGQNSRTAISAIFSFISASEIIEIGTVHLDSELYPTRIHILSTLRRDLQLVASTPSNFPIPFRKISAQDQYISPSSLMEALVKNLLASPGLPMSEAVRYLNLSLLMPLDTQIQPMAAAIDLLQKAFYKQNKISANEVSKAVFCSLRKRFNEALDKTSLTEEERRLLAGKFNRLQEISQARKNKHFLSRLALHFGPLENNALGRGRNTAVHGSLSAPDLAQLRESVAAFRTLLSRIILRLLGYIGPYTDYSWNSGAQHPYLALRIEEPQGPPWLHKASSE